MRPVETMTRIGNKVLVTHQLGTEIGTIVGISREVVNGEGRSVTVKFADGTRSTWHETQLQSITR